MFCCVCSSGSLGFNIMNCVIIFGFVVAAVMVNTSVADVTYEAKTTSHLTDKSSLRMLGTTENSSLRGGMLVKEERMSPYIFRWTDGRREPGDKISVTPWDDYDFNGSKDYEYQLTYRGCRITYIEARLLIVSLDS